MKPPVIQTDVASFLGSRAGARVFFEEMDGNHGDRLILLGARLLLDRVRFEWTDDPARADLIVINGGGSLCAQPWCGDLAQLRGYTQAHPGVEVAVLPSSYYWGDADFAACFRGRTAPTTLFAREKLSLQRLAEADLPEGVSVALDQDLAFHLEGTPLVEDARRVPSEGYILLVERFDEEQATGKPVKIKSIRRYGRYLPVPVQNVVKKMLDRTRAKASGFEVTVLGEALALRPDLAGKPTIYHDVSNTTRNTFEEFVRMIAAADAVVTTRMHAAILAAMLGKPTFMKGKSGAYRKLQGVYEQSLASMPHVYLLES